MFSHGSKGWPAPQAHSMSMEKMALQQNQWVEGPWKKALRGKVQSRDFPTALGNPAKACISTFSTAPATTVNFLISSQEENS
jgi:hypothetical protein